MQMNIFRKLLTRSLQQSPERFTIDRAQKANPATWPEDVPSDPELEPEAKAA